MKKFTNKRGFTLIEVLVVIGIIAILASIVIIAINPQRQFQQANNTQRWSNVNAILNAVHQYAVDNHGALPAVLTNATNTPYAVCQSGVASTTCFGAGLLSLDASLVPTYVVGMPNDPTCVTANSTCYTIATTTGNRIVVTAPNAELNTPISVSR